jgi:DNA-binding LacI/PurR family transcriptional regulator
MGSLPILTAAEQVAAHLRAELLRRRWIGEMPGGDRLALELGVGNKTVESALRQLEHEGLLVGQGHRRKRLINPNNPALPQTNLQIAFLARDQSDQKTGYVLDILHSLESAGHSALFSSKSMTDLGTDVQRIARFVKRTDADAWIILGAPRDVLEWFVAQKIPAMAFAGRRRGLPIAAVGPDKPSVIRCLTRRLVELGHRRIVLLARRGRRLPKPGLFERCFLEELVAHGIPTGDYNLPDWEENLDGFHDCLASIFEHSPPTALIVEEAPFFAATQQFLAGRGLRVPQDVSLVSTDDDSMFEWCKPSISHIRWDSRPVVRRIVRWATNVSHGKEDLRQTVTKAEFVEGGTIGPAAK